MDLADFDYDLPAERIALYPVAHRPASRLLCLDRQTDAITDRQFHELADVLVAGDLLVVNDTRVLAARLFATKASGGAVEVMLERVIDDDECTAQLRASKTPAPGSKLFVGDQAVFEIIERDGAFWRLRALGGAIESLLERFGTVPLPPYLPREAEASDRERYQTVYADNPGAVAAPTAGLHFDQRLLSRLAAEGIGMATLTLHVGAGTYQPIREDIATHEMHAERCHVSAKLVAQVEQTKAAGRRVVAVGTTVVRALETAAAAGSLAPYAGETSIFITPGFNFRAVDALITNFHQPRSTLMLLVSAFASIDSIKRAYQHALDRDYRFLSYGDAMMIS